MSARLALLLLFLPAIAFGKTVSYAIVIGNNAPPASESGLSALRYADDDAVRYQQLFRGLAAETRLFTVLDGETQRRHPGLAAGTQAPTLAGVLSAVDDYARKMDADQKRGDAPVFYFVFSGHGVRPEHGAPYLALDGGALTQELLRDRILARLPSRYSHLIIDACNAGAVVGVRGNLFAHELDSQTVALKPGEAAAILDAQSILRLPTVGVILATTAGQPAHEWSRYESGVFSHEVLSGLLGAADVNGDRQIEYSELQAFIAAANRSVSDPRAVPQIIARPPAVDQNAPLISLSQMRQGTVLSGHFGRLGAFFIQLENGLRYLDAHLAADVSGSLVLPPHGRAALVTEDSAAELFLDGKPLAVEQLLRQPRATATRGDLDFAYRRGLFASEFGAEYYRGFVDSSGAIGVRFGQPPREAKNRRRTAWRRPLGVTLFTSAGALAVACITTAALTVQAKQDFDGTTIQRTAHEANERYTNDLGAALGTGISSALLGITGAIVWPRAERTTPQPSESGSSALGIELSF